MNQHALQLLPGNPPARHGGAGRLVLALAMCTLVMAPALAQSAGVGAITAQGCTPEQTPRLRGGTARLENDLFAGTDQNYTNGVALTLISHDMSGPMRPECLPAPVWLHARLIELVNPGFWNDAGDVPGTQNVVIRVGQSIYTPEDLSRTDLISDDRPYAGLLYTGLAWNRRKHRPGSNSEMLDTREITLGVIGPWSLAEQSQNLIHDAVGEDRFLGWDNQLHNEPAFQLAMDRKYRGYRGSGAIVPGLSADSIRTLGLRVGNIETSATVGIEGRIGWNLPNDFGSYPLRPGAENRPPSAAALRGEPGASTSIGVRPRPGAHLFAILEAKAVGYDFSLDGNLFRSGPSVTRTPWVAQAAIGISAHAIVAGRGVRLALMRVFRTREFEQQVANQAYGSIAMSIDF